MPQLLCLLLGAFCLAFVPVASLAEETSPGGKDVAHTGDKKKDVKPQWLVRFERLLAAEMAEFDNWTKPKQLPLKDLVYLFGFLTETNVVLDPVGTNGMQLVSTAFPDAKVARAIQQTLRSAMLECVPLDGAIFITNNKRMPVGPSAGPEELPKKIRDAFAKKVSFDFVECPLADVVPWLSRQTGMEFRTGPGIDVNQTTLSLRLLNIPFQQAFAWILRVKGYGYRVEGDEAIRLLSKPER